METSSAQGAGEKIEVPRLLHFQARESKARMDLEQGIEKIYSPARGGFPSVNLERKGHLT